MGFTIGGFFDDMVKYGAESLDDVQESLSEITGNVTNFFESDVSTNPGVHTQPEPLKADNKGNAVTTPQGGNWRPPPQPMNTKTMLMIGGGVLLLLGVTVIAVKK